MAKVGGRVSWIAWPAMLGCIAVIVVLLVLALPGVPGAVDFVGSTLRGATSAAAADAERDAAAFEPPVECRDLYPDRLWVDLTWTPSVQLSPDTSPPEVDAALVTALAPAVRFSCVWRTEDGRTIRSTLSTVAAGSAGVLQAALSSSGASCTVDGERTHCEHSADGVTRIDDIQGDTWLSSTLTDWLPDDYGAQTASTAFPR